MNLGNFYKQPRCEIGNVLETRNWDVMLGTGKVQCLLVPSLFLPNAF